MKDDVLARIQRALDERTNLEEDLELQRTFAMDPEAAQVASELAAIDEALRGMTDPVLSEADLDRLVSSIEGRLDEALPPIADPTAPPALDDDEDPAAADAPARQETRELSALAAPERPSLDSLPPELLESLPPESPADLPPRPVSLKPIERTGERFSLTSVAPPPPLHPLPPASDRAPPPKHKSRAGVVVALFGGTLAAAAGVLLVFLFSTMGRDEDLAFAPPGDARETPERALQLDEALPAAPVTADPQAQAIATPEATEAARAGSSRGGFFPEDSYGRAEGGDGTTGSTLGIVGGVERQDQALARRPREVVQAEVREIRDTEENDRDSPVETVSEPEEQEPADDPRDPPAEGASATPSRDDVIAAMRAIVPAVAACGGGARSGVAEVRIRVGSSGRVQSSVVIGQFAGTPEGSCIARAARGARFQPFTEASFEFTYPFRLE